MLGLLGSLLGAGIGIGAMAWFAGRLTPVLLWLAGGVSVGGVLLTVLAALVPTLSPNSAPNSHRSSPLNRRRDQRRYSVGRGRKVRNMPRSVLRTRGPEG
jgi:hypothetical protein